MAVVAEVIDLGEVRRERAARAMASGRSSMPPPMPMAWMPVWFVMPMWVSAQAGDLGWQAHA